MKLYYCQSCKSISKALDQDAIDDCPKCGKTVHLLDVDAEQWDTFSEQEKTNIIEKIANKSKSPKELGLAYHKFIWFFILPLNFIFCVIQIINLAYFDINTVMLACCALTAIISFIGFFRWKPYSYYSILLYTGVMILYSLITSSQLGVTFIAGIIYAFINFRYYAKRKELFFSGFTTWMKS